MQAGGHARVERDGTSEMDEVHVVETECRVASVNIVGRHRARMRGNHYNLVLYAGVGREIRSMSNYVVVRSVA